MAVAPLKEDHALNDHFVTDPSFSLMLGIVAMAALRAG